MSGINLKDLILMPPVAFLIILGTTIALAEFLSVFSFKQKDRPEGLGKSYGCGEEVSDSRIQPDYGEFFPFAFFFTILHVVALMIVTMPIQTMQSFAIALVYIGGGITGLFILFRR